MKWPEKEQRLLQAYEKMELFYCESTTKKVGMVRDEEDIPVLSDAAENKMDIIVSGDLDFLESEIPESLIFPRMMMGFLDGE